MQTNTSPSQTGLQKFDSRLNRHFLACSAFVGTAALMSAQNASASIVYSGLQNISVPTTNDAGGIYLDLTLPGSSFIPTTAEAGNGQANTVLPGWDFLFYGSNSGAGNLTWYYPKLGGVPQTFSVPTGGNPGQSAALTAGVTIDGSSTFALAQGMDAEFAGTTAYMGVEFHDAGNNVRYGWVRVSGGSPSGLPATVIDWAYEDSGNGITVGAVPEPSTLALGFLSAGAFGLAAWRKRKKS